MTPADFMRRVDAVPWSELQGEREISDVPGALRALLEAPGDDCDEWAGALEIFWAHVTPQGQLYAVTPHAVPFLSALASAAPLASSVELHGVLHTYREVAERHLQAAEPRLRELGARTLEALRAPVEPVDLPPRPPPALESLEEIALELEGFAGSVRGADYRTQSSALGRSEYFLGRAPADALAVALAIDDPQAQARARLVRARALHLLGRRAEAEAIAWELVEDWLAPPRPGAVNQSLTREVLLALLQELGPHRFAGLAAQVAEAAEPEVALLEGDQL